MPSIYDILTERGLVADVTDATQVRELLDRPPVTFYAGFDPTADSLHVGHLLPIIVMAHLQRAGHRPIAVVGGGTGMIGDPSGKTDLRDMLTPEQIAVNLDAQKKQLRQFLLFEDDNRAGSTAPFARDVADSARAKMVNNADWLAPLNYIEFLRDIGVHFTVNRMLAAESFKQRWEKGLTFIEFNYMLLQAYDFLTLNEREGCRLQLGGSDQWGNICAGADLTRRVRGVEVFGLVIPLLLTSSGKKMGKTEKGALWLSAERTSPYDFYQYWRNVDDKDVEKCLRMLTFLPMDDVSKLANVEPGPALNEAKKRLAFEMTKLVHGEQSAREQQLVAASYFNKKEPSTLTAPGLNVPEQNMISRAELEKGFPIVDALLKVSLVNTKSEARRLIEQGGAYVNEEKVNSLDRRLNLDDVRGKDQIILRAGKKKHQPLFVEEEK